jgi:hypothetical protein
LEAAVKACTVLGVVAERDLWGASLMASGTSFKGGKVHPHASNCAIALSGGDEGEV